MSEYFDKFDGVREYMFSMDEHADMAIFNEILAFLGGPFQFDIIDGQLCVSIPLTWDDYYNFAGMMGYDRYLGYESFHDIEGVIE